MIKYKLSSLNNQFNFQLLFNEEEKIKCSITNN